MTIAHPFLKVLTAIAFTMAAGVAQGQAPSYGADVTVDQAKKIAAAALVEARKNSWNVAIAIVNTHGVLVYYEKMEDTQTASPTIAIEKARTAAMYRRPTRALEEVINKGRHAALNLSNVMPISGGLPISSAGKIIGAIGVSGVTSDQDEQIARAGVDILK